MDIQIKWGFMDESRKLNPDSVKINAGDKYEGVDDQYAHELIGRGLAVEVKVAAKTATKQAAPKENK